MNPFGFCNALMHSNKTYVLSFFLCKVWLGKVERRNDIEFITLCKKKDPSRLKLICWPVGLDPTAKNWRKIDNFAKPFLGQSVACLIYTFSASFSSSFTFQTSKFTSSYICNSNDKWNDISNDWMLSVQMPFAVSQKR